VLLRRGIVFLPLIRLRRSRRFRRSATACGNRGRLLARRGRLASYGCSCALIHVQLGVALLLGSRLMRRSLLRRWALLRPGSLLLLRRAVLLRGSLAALRRALRLRGSLGARRLRRSLTRLRLNGAALRLLGPRRLGDDASGCRACAVHWLAALCLRM